MTPPIGWKNTTGWKDTTSYRQGERDGEPREWTLRTEHLRVTVHHHMHYPPDQWLVSCHELNIEMMELKSKEVEKAKEEALLHVLAYVNRVSVTLTKAMQAVGVLST